MSETAEAARGTATTTTTTTVESARTIALRLRAPRRVRFDETAVDNEHLGRRKSKSCCIYHRRRAFDESSDESGDECDDHCGECAPDPAEATPGASER
jgi:protein phosphatase 1 regulatory subunit 11